MAQRIVVVGSSNTDMILKLDRIPRPGETRLGGEFVTAAGGKGANQAVAAARAGASVSLIARVGRDMFGERAVAGLLESGVNVDYVQFDEAPSGVALIFVGDDGENSIGVSSGANAKLSPSDIAQAKDVFEAADVVMMQLETPLDTVKAAAGLAEANGTTTILNPAPARPLPDDLLKRISILTPNESEAELLTGIAVQDDESCERAADVLLDRGVETVIITLGARGAFVASSATREVIPGFKVQQIDSTAAGDTFNGALAVAIAEGHPIVEAVRMANAAAAISVTRLGAQPSAPDREEIQQFLNSETLRTRHHVPSRPSQLQMHNSLPQRAGMPRVRP